MESKKRGEREKKKKKKKKRKRKKAKKGMDCMDSMDFWTLVWMIVYSISRVYLGIHPNPRFVESWVGKTLVCIR